LRAFRATAEECEHFCCTPTPLVALSDWLSFEPQNHQCIEVGSPKLLQGHLTKMLDDRFQVVSVALKGIRPDVASAVQPPHQELGHCRWIPLHERSGGDIS
jgi:hypothetical protein